MSLPYADVFRDQTDEHAFPVTRVSGTIPVDLDGAFLRNGPGRMAIGGHQLNFFDGHALIAGVSFSGGAATFRSRFVRTPLNVEEVAKGAVVQRRVFSNHPKRWANLFALKFGNSAMHDVYAWGEGAARRVVAGNDPGHFALDPKTLDTIGPETWGGAVEAGDEMGPMPYADPASGHLIGWIKRPGGARPDRLRFVEVDSSWKVVRETPWHTLDTSPAVVHDQRATPRWFIATEQALRLSPMKALWGAATVWGSLSVPQGATATLLLAPREGDGPMVRVPLPAPVEIAFHVINAWDDGDVLVVDLVTYDADVRFDTAVPPEVRASRGLPDGESARPRPVRYRVDPRAGKVLDARPLGSAVGDAPEVADHVMGRQHRYAYLPAIAQEGPPDRGFFGYADGVARVDVETGETRTWRAGALVTPVTFVARPGATDEDDGWLLTWLARAEGAAVAILDARDVEAGPVATLELGVHLPGASHTRWAAKVALQG